MQAHLLLGVGLSLLGGCASSDEIARGSDAGADAGDLGEDAGHDSGTDAGVDAGRDAGHDAGVDAYVDVGPGPYNLVVRGAGWTAYDDTEVILVIRNTATSATTHGVGHVVAGALYVRRQRVLERGASYEVRVFHNGDPTNYCTATDRFWAFSIGNVEGPVEHLLPLDADVTVTSASVCPLVPIPCDLTGDRCLSVQDIFDMQAQAARMLPPAEPGAYLGQGDLNNDGRIDYIDVDSWVGCREYFGGDGACHP